ncbi:hypothetical protein ES707_22105 [subsurface metagenome]
MVCADLAIVGSDRWTSPIAPAEIGGNERWRCRSLVWPRKNPIGLTECMLRDTCPFENLRRYALRDQWARG